ncbi:MAG TPA: hypothetical protein VFH11_04955 [Gemmatimonadota bacterium]|nr:hypothetical protein [Gemmatimonadota bacterium]
MRRAHRRARWFSALALLVSLIVPARAIALCCLDGPAEREESAEAHAKDSHHERVPVDAGESALTMPAPASECSAFGPTILLGERSRPDSAPGLREVALASPPTFRIALFVSKDMSTRLQPLVDPPDGPGKSLPLRL